MFPEQAKTIYVWTIYNKDKKWESKKYRPVSILSSFSKLFEKFTLLKSLSLLLWINFYPNLYQHVGKHIAQIMFS